MTDCRYKQGVESLVQHVYEVLLLHPDGIREFDLMAALDNRCVAGFGETAFADHLSMFQSHFLLFHSLYLLRDRLHQQAEAGLDIHCLSIRLTPFVSQARGGIQQHDPLRDYYLDPGQMEKTDAAEVDQLLHGFWQRFVAMDERQEALQQLGLCDPVDYAQIKAQYRRLVMEHHPDRGGDHSRLLLINEAMQVLTVNKKGQPCDV